MPLSSPERPARRAAGWPGRARLLGAALFWSLTPALPVADALRAAPDRPPAGVTVIDIAPVWAGHPVNFALLTRGDAQFAAYYDANRQLTVAQRTIGRREWRCKVLPTALKWDAHNAVVLGLDRAGHLHVSGNMHAIPLIYFRATAPRDVMSLEPVHRMTGQDESRVTYPVFLQGPDGELVFNYRSGRSGNGDTLFNRYDEATRTWRRLVEQPLLDGEGRMNAYPVGPTRGPDGYYHYTWVWRDRPPAGTGEILNHDLSYARSRDLVHWEAAGGAPLALPIRLGAAHAIVDPVPVRGGIINSSGRVGFDAAGRVVLAYLKFDAAGRTQLWLARHEAGRWQHHEASNWDYRWENYRGDGSIVFEISHGSVTPRADGRLFIPIRHVRHGAGLWEIEARTMKLKAALDPGASGWPEELAVVRSTFPGMMVRWAEDPLAGRALAARLSPSYDLRGREPLYVLRWETLDFHNDKPRPEPWPAPSMLQLVECRGPAP